MKALCVGLVFTVCFLPNNEARAGSMLGDSLYRRYDPNYIRSYPKSLVLAPIMTFQNIRLGFSSLREPSTRVSYSTNLVPQYGLDVDYSWFSFELTGSWGIKDEHKEKGTTQQLSIGGSLTLPKWIAFGNMSFYKGFYVANPLALRSLYSEPAVIYSQRSDFQVLTGRGSCLYVFNSSKYSHAAALSVSSQRQLKSAGSMLLGATVHLISMWADSSLIPDAIAPHFDSSNFVTGRDYVMLLANTGYAYTYVFREKWFVNGVLQGGLGPVYSHTRPEDKSLSKSRLDLGATLEGRLSFGYNTDRFFAGVLGYVITNASTAGSESSINNLSYFLRFFVGYRIPIRFKVPILG